MERLRELAELRATQCRIHEAADPAPPPDTGVRDSVARATCPLRARAARLRAELVRQREARVLGPATGGGEVVRLTRGPGGGWGGEMEVSVAISRRGELLCVEHRCAHAHVLSHGLAVPCDHLLGLSSETEGKEKARSGEGTSVRVQRKHTYKQCVCVFG